MTLLLHNGVGFADTMKRVFSNAKAFVQRTVTENRPGQIKLKRVIFAKISNFLGRSIFLIFVVAQFK